MPKNVSPETHIKKKRVSPDTLSPEIMLLPDSKKVERYASVRERMRNGFARKMNRAKGARHAHAAIRAAGGIPGAAATQARKANCAARREAKAKDASLGKQWRVSSIDLAGA